MNYRIRVEYEGTRYNGWQRQDSTGNTIQGKLEQVLSRMVDCPIEIQGAGRTDSGVHAKGQIANFHLNPPHSEKAPREIMAYMNLYLPEDIRITNIAVVPERFHSRLNAKGKIYQYRIWNSDKADVFERRLVYTLEDRLDVKAMKEAAVFFVGTHDFIAFCTNKNKKKSTIRTIESVEIETMGDEIRITYRGNGFLYHMIRIMTGTLIEVGLGKRKPSDITGILEGRNRADAGELIPGNGLVLVEVLY